MFVGAGSKENMGIQLQPADRNGKNGASFSNKTVREHNGGGPAYSTNEPEESIVLLCREPSGSNGESSTNATQAQTMLENGYSHNEVTAWSKIKEELNEVVFWKIKLWMIIVFIFLFIFAIVWISLILCSVIHEDVDEKFDPSSFRVPLYYNGSFLLTNQVFTEELLSLSSNQSQALATELQQKLADLYRSSPALGRYFSTAEIYAFRNGSVIAEYRLKFLMPAEHRQLEKFTLSREMVYNVFRQLLYDQDPDGPGSMYIDPISLIMF
ncbi:hypothetical protein LDENG_00250220 [Lucifuga dentata]|nr:hypothetical protein LDENG_00250220 [Lucifuga dentata]